MFAKLDSRMKILILYVLKNKAKVQAKCDSTFDCSVESYSEQAPCPQPENAGEKEILGNSSLLHPLRNVGNHEKYLGKIKLRRSQVWYWKRKKLEALEEAGSSSADSLGEVGVEVLAFLAGLIGELEGWWGNPLCAASSILLQAAVHSSTTGRLTFSVVG
ncbi:hypothetical protein V6N11_057175 [Hibiscus sabdariffa]|uniref:Uncharacterized protein n=1 Tax=Hibiscus sabdariffa TaxID=183260 RepID=A0ABR1ZDS6_9ROSI